MLAKRALLALDAGSGGGRCLIVDPAGNQLAAAYRPWEFRTPPGLPTGAEFDPEEFWTTLCSVAREAIDQAGLGPDDVLGIGCTSLRDGVVFLDGDGREIYAGSNRDARSIALGGEMQKKWGELMTPRTGRTPLGLDAAAHLLWYQRVRAEEFARISHILMVSDWLVYRLTGECTADPSNSSSSQLFDVNAGRWSPEIADALGLPWSIFPPVRSPGEIAGHLTAAAANGLGLSQGVPVSVGVGDSQAGCLGSGAVEEGQTTVIAGTTIPVQMTLARPVHDSSRRIWVGAHAVPGRWSLEANGGSAGTVYAWVCRDIYPEFGPDDPAGYEHINEAAAAEPPGQVFAYLGPQVSDFSKLSFPPMAAFLAPTMGLGVPFTRPRMARAVLENIAFATRGNVLQCEEVAGLVSTDLFVCGGLSRSRPFVQILADVLERPVKVPVVHETTALGATMAAAVATGVYPDLFASAAGMARVEATIEPDPETARKYRGIIRRWENLRAALPR